MRRAMVVAVASVAAFVGGMVVPAGADAAKAPRIKVSRMVDCEDQDVQPCIVRDDGKWRLVLSYKPYTSRVVKKCTWYRPAPCFTHRQDTFEYRWRYAIGEK